MSSRVFREYIGTNFNGVRFSSVPIDSRVTFHFILAFATDYTTTVPHVPTNGNFNVFWDQGNLSPDAVSAIKSQHPNVKVALSLGGATLGSDKVNFSATNVQTWVTNAVNSLTNIINQYHLDGIDINYENFQSQTPVFVDCIGQLITNLRAKNLISFASIAPYENNGPDGQASTANYKALWNSYKSQIDYVNFQFYGYPDNTTVQQFLQYYDRQQSNYPGGKIMASMISDGSGGLTVANGFFNACTQLRDAGKLPGIFVWSADLSLATNFPSERQAQNVLIN